MRISSVLRSIGLACLLCPTAQAAEPEIAYLRLTGGFWQVWVTDTEGAQHVQVSFDETDKTRVSWLPDRKQLICNTSDGRIQRIAVDGKLEQDLDLPVSGMFDAQVSPDGKQLAFSLASTQKKDNNSVWIVGVDGTGLRKLTNQPGLAISPAWAPDANAIIYSSGKTVKAHELWKASVDGKRQEQISTGRATLKVDPAVSTAGDIAWSDNRHGSHDIWIHRKGGGEPVRITDMPEFEGEPSWSPDGKSLVFSVFRAGEQRIWVSDPEGLGARPITPADARSRAPAWAL
ncbi:MAG: PD40 domain-containing protein [Thiogranum sp.]|nr:PD40 domain-containing protein [Thiogranum sp.]